jgi:tetratricopeptide (TPR) repeat protein
MTRFLAVNALAQHQLFQTRDTPEAIALCEELLQISRAVWGRGHISGLSILLQLASLNAQQSNLTAAERAMREFIEDRRAVGSVANSIILMLEQQAYGAMREWLADHPETGRDYLTLVVEDARAALAPQAPERQIIIDRVAVWLAERGFHQVAEPLLRESLELLAAQEEPAAAARARSLHWLGAALLGLERPQDAQVALRACLEIEREELGAEEWLLHSARSALGECLVRDRRYQDAEPILLEAHAALLSNLLAPPQRRRDAAQRLALLYRAWDRPDDAAAWESRARP